jgi:predicted phosphoadenosine phosphosulfate sulfurtransferase
MRIYSKRFIEKDVLTAARERFDTIMDRFDDAYVAFSGGKDSLVCLHLLKEAWDRAGRKGPIKAAFWDEELIPDAVVDFVNEYRQKDWIKLFWFCYPLESNKFCLGKISKVIQWDPDRPHVREKPPWAILPPAGQPGPFSQYTMTAEVAKHCRGRICNVTGIRAEESPSRYGSVACKLHDNWLAGTDCPTVVHAKPIYDWSELDIFKFLGESGIRYCGLYDGQLYSRTQFRVSTPLHSGSAKKFQQWRLIDPDFHARVTRVFPEMLLQERYYRQLRNDGEPTVEAMLDWIEENVEESKRLRAIHYARSIERDTAKGTFGDDDWKEAWAVLKSGRWLKGQTFVQKAEYRRKR